MSESTLPGGWTAYSCDITKDAQKVFDKVTDHLIGVKYTLVAFATQVVEGTKYSFFCNSRVVYPDAPYQPALVDVFKPLDDEPYITGIRILEP